MFAVYLGITKTIPMKTKRPLRLFIITLLALACLDSFGQTKVRNIAIQSDTHYEIYVIYPDTMLKATDTLLEEEWGWKYNEAINFNSPKGMTLKTAFVTCSDTTYLNIGGQSKHVTKGGKFILDGGLTEIGN